MITKYVRIISGVISVNVLTAGQGTARSVQVCISELQKICWQRQEAEQAEFVVTHCVCLVIRICMSAIQKISHTIRLIANLFTEKCVNFQRLFIATHR